MGFLLGRSASRNTAFLEPNVGIVPVVVSATYKRKVNLENRNWGCKSPTTLPQQRFFFYCQLGWSRYDYVQELAGFLSSIKVSVVIRN
jgi:hypothetical protein